MICNMLFIYLNQNKMGITVASHLKRPALKEFIIVINELAFMLKKNYKS